VIIRDFKLAYDLPGEPNDKLLLLVELVAHIELASLDERHFANFIEFSVHYFTPEEIDGLQALEEVDHESFVVRVVPDVVAVLRRSFRPGNRKELFVVDVEV